MATINVAAMAGVAKSTVSRYLNGENMKQGTKERIQRAIEETGYEPNSFARSLKARHTNLIGIVIGKLDSYANAQCLRGFDRAMSKEGYQLLISNAYSDISREIEGLYTFAKQKVDGILFFGTAITENHREAFREISCPIVMAGQESEDVYCVYHDDYGAGVQMANYIGGRGLQSVLYFGITESDRAIGVARKAGLQETLNKCRIEFSEVTTSLEFQDAYALALKKLPEFRGDSVVCATDVIAAGVLKASQVLGYRVPEDFSLSAFGGEEISDIVYPTITTVQYQYEEAGRQAAAILKKLIYQEEVEQKKYCLENVLNIKKSS